MSEQTCHAGLMDTCPANGHSMSSGASEERDWFQGMVIIANLHSRRYAIARRTGSLPGKDWFSLDDLIADPVLRINSVPGCTTEFCCSGHPWSPDSGYIRFLSLSDPMRARLANLSRWHFDPEAHLHPTLRSNAVTYMDCLDAAAELAGALCNIRNLFTEDDNPWPR